jgi:transcriptional regulator with XRE-family HTH domain
MERTKLERELIAAGVRMARAKIRWSQSRLAEMAGLTKPTINRVEAGGVVTFATITAVSQALDLSLDDLRTLGSFRVGGADAVES